MTNTRIQGKLYDNCRWNNTDKVKNILENYDNLDILYENGKFFNFAISENNQKIVGYLIKYFEDNKLNKSKKSLDLINNLKETLESCVYGEKISHEMQQVLSPYIDFDNSLENRSNDSMFETIDIIETENETKTTPIKRSYSTGDLSNSTNIFSSDSSSNHSSGKKTNIIDNMFLHDKDHDFQTDKIEDTHIVGETQSNDAF